MSTRKPLGTHHDVETTGERLVQERGNTLGGICGVMADRSSGAMPSGSGDVGQRRRTL
ncbi:hypothetical protein [Aureimonas jatrophae]|uniref:Uncharacterized protein n=1 Tax=Aureimonas jatrophae TaxID=1166073 RepID=A0A1H0MIY4_9HYPH|nr:hypothetical protein [Aureimonas jatrophae]MBB3952939.1 hypothetical protein [Aureimonas jatrophae]SDO80314.1 hypothetical protein SAMN05192530_11418 [Aureimonas jatrophae]